MATSNLGCVVVAVDSREESMKALRWALDNLRLRPAAAAGAAAADPGVLIILHVQHPLSIASSLNPGSIPSGGPSDVEAHQQRTTDAIFKRALDMCADRNVTVRTEVMIGDPKVMICKATVTLYADLLVIGRHSIRPISW
uniref:UspA domain-containing protein n=1 Tax=Ananas comosus var. bracteatus TaxID=296719 RepID=A0A6V7P2S1_ANACO|nr:unnamed protein product [Ananas comosus var. bracteatus]